MGSLLISFVGVYLGLGFVGDGEEADDCCKKCDDHLLLFVDGGCLGLGFVDGEDECADESDECEYVLHSFLLC